jgi:DNA-binding CsgD family transcriptional regulator
MSPLAVHAPPRLSALPTDLAGGYLLTLTPDCRVESVGSDVSAQFAAAHGLVAGNRAPVAPVILTEEARCWRDLVSRALSDGPFAATVVLSDGHTVEFSFRPVTRGTTRSVVVEGRTVHPGSASAIGQPPSVPDDTRMPALLRILNEERDTPELLDRVVESLRHSTGCQATGIRQVAEFESALRAGGRRDAGRLARTDGGHCDYEAVGFDVMACPCLAVIEGRPFPAGFRATRDRGVWTASLGDAVKASTTEGAARVGRCFEGAESLAIVPLRHRETVLGVLWVSDPARSRLDGGRIDFLDDAAGQIAIALAHRAELLVLRDRMRQVVTLLGADTYEPQGGRPALPLRLATQVNALSPRELEVLRSLRHHRRIAAVAKELARSVHTVRNQVKAILRKLGLHSQTELLARLDGAPPDRGAPPTRPPRPRR